MKERVSERVMHPITPVKATPKAKAAMAKAKAPEPEPKERLSDPEE